MRDVPDLAPLATALGGVANATGAIEARRGDRVVTYRLVNRGAGSYHEAWTEVAAPRPAPYPLTMHVERGRARPNDARVDIELGTPVFDEFFVVEAAPADVVRLLVDETARAFLMAQTGAIELFTRGDAIVFARVGWVTDPTAAAPLVDFVAGLAARLRDAYAAADQAAAEPGGAPYRPHAPNVATREDRRAEEVAAIGEVQRARYAAFVRQGNRVVIAIVAVVLLAILVGVVLVR